MAGYTIATLDSTIDMEQPIEEEAGNGSTTGIDGWVAAGAAGLRTAGCQNGGRER